MRNKLIVVIDLSLLKAYRFETTRLNTPRLVLVDEVKTEEAHSKLTDKLSDAAGRYRVPSSNMAMSYGERGKVDLEIRKRLTKQLADGLKRLLDDPEIHICYLAASREINHSILEGLPANARAKITKNLACDLAKVDKNELLNHFLKEAPAVA